VAGRILWLDALTVNVDRSWRNPNLLVWHQQLWAIDHGATLLFQHTWPGVDAFAIRPYPLAEHALAPFRRAVAGADDELSPLLTESLLAEVVALVPAGWLADADRPAYVEYLLARNAASATWLPGVAA
jgi:hypothetical protein